MKLYPVTNSGYVIQGDNGRRTYDAKREAGGKVCAVCFYNEGQYSNVNVEYGGVVITLVPGSFHEITMPYCGYDTTLYTYYFKSTAEREEVPVFSLRISIQKYVEGVTQHENGK